MIAAMAKTGKLLAINWPLAWYPAARHRQAADRRRRIGDVIEVHYYDGNRGPLYHVADKVEITPEQIAGAEAASPGSTSKPHGGGSLLDYLGYGTTLGTWFHDGEAPLEVTAVVDQPAGPRGRRAQRHHRPLPPRPLQVRDALGHVHRPLDAPAAAQVRLRHRRHRGHDLLLRLRAHHPRADRAHPEGETLPVDELRPPFQNPIEYCSHCIEHGRPIEGPLSPAISRIGQQIVDSRRPERRASGAPCRWCHEA